MIQPLKYNGFHLTELFRLHRFGAALLLYGAVTAVVQSQQSSSVQCSSVLHSLSIPFCLLNSIAVITIGISL